MRNRHKVFIGGMLIYVAGILIDKHTVIAAIFMLAGWAILGFMTPPDKKPEETHPQKKQYNLQQIRAAWDLFWSRSNFTETEPMTQMEVLRPDLKIEFWNDFEKVMTGNCKPADDAKIRFRQPAEKL